MCFLSSPLYIIRLFYHSGNAGTLNPKPQILKVCSQPGCVLLTADGFVPKGGALFKNGGDVAKTETMMRKVLNPKP